MATADTQASRLQTAVGAARLRAETVPGVVGMLAVVGVLAFIYRTFSPLVEPMVLRLWLATMLLCPLGFALWVLARLYRRPDDAEVVRRWQPAGLAIAGLLDLCAIASIWILLPAADPPLLLLMVVLYVWFLATQMMVSSTIARLSSIGPIGIPLSLMVQLLRGDVPYGEPLAIFVACIGLTLFALGRLIARAKTQLQAARLLSEQAAVTLGETLARVAAERDAKTRFIAAASHDLQQPLQSASLFFEAAIATEAVTEHGAGDAAARHRAIAGARQAFAATRALIAQMLDYLRLEAGVVRPRLETVALGPLIAGVAFEYEPAARGAGMRLVALPGHRQVVADQALLRRVLGNLVDNALRHARGERVLIGARQRGSLVTLWVIDDGNGISPADAGRLFDDFAQGSDDDGVIRGGFGLGLASVRRSTALMSGTAGHERRWTGGAAFYVTLPAAAPAIEAICRAA